MSELDHVVQETSHIWNICNSSKLHEEGKCARDIMLETIKGLKWCFSIHLNQIQSPQSWRHQVPPKCWHKHITMQKTIISVAPPWKPRNLSIRVKINTKCKLNNSACINMVITDTFTCKDTLHEGTEIIFIIIICYCEAIRQGTISKHSNIK
jgi:hypothetical protein